MSGSFHAGNAAAARAAGSFVAPPDGHGGPMRPAPYARPSPYARADHTGKPLREATQFMFHMVKTPGLFLAKKAMGAAGCSGENIAAVERVADMFTEAITEATIMAGAAATTKEGAMAIGAVVTFGVGVPAAGRVVASVMPAPNSLAGYVGGMVVSTGLTMAAQAAMNRVTGSNI